MDAVHWLYPQIIPTPKRVEYPFYHFDIQPLQGWWRSFLTQGFHPGLLIFHPRWGLGFSITMFL